MRGKLSFADATVTVYEIHMGINTGEALSKSALIINDLPEGAISADNRIADTYVHGHLTMQNLQLPS